MKAYYEKQMKKHFKLYEKAVDAGDDKKSKYHMQEYLNYEKTYKSKG